MLLIELCWSFRSTHEVDYLVREKMIHPICRVRAFEIVAPFALRVQFDDGTEQNINFEPMLAGRLYGSLRDLAIFNQVRIDPEVHTLVWPNGADFDPATLHDWPQYADALKARAQKWEAASV
jgi:Protein of unknown function (DUF2442)